MTRDDLRKEALRALRDAPARVVLEEVAGAAALFGLIWAAFVFLPLIFG